MALERSPGEGGSDEDGDGERDRRFVAALARGLDVLRAFRAGEVEMSNQMIAERTRLPRPTVSRLTFTLTELGYLLHSPRSGNYRLGPGVMALGYTMLANTELRERARPFMQELADRASVTVALGARDRLSMVYLEVARGPQIITISRGVGARVPIETTAMGRAVLASLPFLEREYLLRALRDRDPSGFPAIERAVSDAADELAEHGFCTSLGDWMRDVNAVAVPIFAPDNESIYALNAGGPSFMVDQEQLTAELGPQLAQIAEQLNAPHSAG